MNRALTIFCVLLLAAAALPATAVAQEMPTAAGNDAPESVERIDENTVLVDSSYDAETGTGTIVIRSEVLQQVTITDAGAFMAGGDIPRRTVTLRPDETATIEMPLTEYNGNVGVTIGTSIRLYGEPIEHGQPIIAGPFTATDVRNSGISAAATISIWVIGYVLYALSGRSDEPEWLA